MTLPGLDNHLPKRIKGLLAFAPRPLRYLTQELPYNKTTILKHLKDLEQRGEVRAVECVGSPGRVYVWELVETVLDKPG